MLSGFNAAWFLDGGSTGSVAYYFPIAFIFAVLFFRGLWRWVVSVLVAIDAAALVLIEHEAPGLVIPFADSSARVFDLVSGMLISGFACLLIVLVVLRSYHEERRKLTVAHGEIEAKLAEIRTLRGLLPVCAWCRRIRDDEGLWKGVDEYLRDHTNAEITHALCPDCEREHFERYYEDRALQQVDKSP